MFERPYPHTPAGQMFKEYFGELGTDGILWVEKAGNHAIKGKWGIHIVSKTVVIPEGETVTRGIPATVRTPKVSAAKGAA